MRLRNLSNEALAVLIETLDWLPERVDLLSEVCRALRATPERVTAAERIAQAFIARSVPYSIENEQAAEHLAKISIIIAKGV